MAFNVYVCMYRFQFTNHSIDLQKSSQKRIQNISFVLKSSWITLRHSIYIIVRELHVENECKREYSVQIKRLEWRYQQQISVRFESWTFCVMQFLQLWTLLSMTKLVILIAGDNFIDNYGLYFIFQEQILNALRCSTTKPLVFRHPVS